MGRDAWRQPPAPPLARRGQIDEVVVVVVPIELVERHGPIRPSAGRPHLVGPQRKLQPVQQAGHPGLVGGATRTRTCTCTLTAEERVWALVLPGPEGSKGRDRRGGRGRRGAGGADGGDSD